MPQVFTAEFIITDIFRNKTIRLAEKPQSTRIADADLRSKDLKNKCSSDAKHFFRYIERY